VKKGIENGIITNDFYWVDVEDLDPKNEENLVWISLDDPKQYNSFAEIITINGIQGRLTKKGSCYNESRKIFNDIKINADCVLAAGKFMFSATIL